MSSASNLTLADVRARLPLDDADLVPPVSLFTHHSYIHGQLHVARVLVNALALLARTGRVDETARLWAAVYLHDIAREHDGRCARHGADAWARLADLPDVQALFARGGVCAADYPAIEYAVSIHCSGEPAPSDAHYRLGALLKDADALDRVRLNDLKLRLLRHPEARELVPFAQRLHDTSLSFAPGPGLFARLWAVATEPSSDHPATARAK